MQFFARPKETNVLAHWGNELIRALNSFSVQGPGLPESFAEEEVDEGVVCGRRLGEERRDHPESCNQNSTIKIHLDVRMKQFDAISDL